MAAVLAAGLAIALNVGKVPTALPLLREELGLTLVQAGWLASLLTTMAVVAAAAVGSVVGRLGALRMVLVGLSICAAASLVPALAPGWPALLGARVLEGLGFMLVAVACPALVTAATLPRDRRFAIGLWSSYMPAGASLAMLASPALLQAFGWRGVWALTALALVASAAVLWRRRGDFDAIARPSTPLHAPAGAGALAALRQPLPWILAAVFASWAAQHFALIVWMPTYLQEQRGVTAGLAATLTGVMLMACVPGTILGGWAVQRGVPRGWLIALAQLATGLGAWVYTREAAPDALRLAAAIGVSFVGGLMPAAVMASSTVLARSAPQIGVLQGLYMQGAQLGQFVGTPLVAALVAGRGQWSASLAVTLPAAAAGVLLALATLRIEARLAR